MIPKKLTIKGIYSYQKEEVIDFEKLTKNALFGIFGRVGSGKSSILEAISYVLYGKIERLNQKDGIAYNMMNLKSNKLFIDYEFGVEEKKYKFTVEAKRRKNFTDIQTPERNQYVWQEKAWQPAQLSAEEILDLDYENFRRTIIIPQGKFQEFLQLGQTERTKMLKDIFHLQQFDLGRKLVPIEDENKTFLTQLQTKIEGLGEVGKQLIKEKQEELTEISKKLKEDILKLEKFEKEKVEQENLKILFEEVQAKSKILSELKKEENKWQTLESQIKAYRTCQTQFKDLLERQDSTQKSITDTQNSIESKSQTYTGLEKELQEKKILFETVKTDFEQKENWRNQIKELKQILDIQILTNSLNDIKARIEKGKPYLEEKVKLITELDKKLQAQEQKHKEKRLELPDMVLLSKVDTWFQEKNNILSNSQKIEENITLHEKEIKNILAEKNSIFEQDIIQDAEIENQEDIALLVENIENYKKEKQEKREQIRQKITDLTTQKKLEEFAQHLHDNPDEACPLCGSTEHPKIWKIENAEQEIQSLKSETDFEKGQIEALEDVLKKLRNCQTRIKAKQREIEREQKKVERERQYLEKQFDKFQSRWKPTFDPHDEREVERQKDKAARLDKSIKAFETKINQLKTELKTESQKKEKYQKELDTLEKEVIAGKSQIDTLEKNIQILNLADYIQKDKNLLEEDIKNLNKKYKTTVENYNNLNQTIQNIQKQETTLGTEIKVAKENLEKEKTKFEQLKTELKNRMLKADFEGIEMVKAILQQNLDVEKEEQNIQNFKQKLFQNQDKLKELQSKISDRTFDDNIFQELLDNIKNLQEVIKHQGKIETKLEVDIKKLERDLAKKLDLEEKLKSKELKQSDIEELKKLFRGEGFVKYISSVYLQNLCELANNRFYKLTNQRLQLEIDEKNNFLVRDFLNDGQTRSVKTLSGGQTFQAALSLALALADSIQRFNKSSQNFFFLDEGFGSQDEESLEIVFNTLKSLQKENRIVGIISHVEKLQREIPVFLKVHNHEEKGSEIVRSWEKLS